MFPPHPQPESSAYPHPGPHSTGQGFLPPQGAYQPPFPGHPPPPSSYLPVGHPNQGQSAHIPAYSGSGPRQWAPQGPLASAPTASQVQTSTYNPSVYGPMPGAYQAPVSPIGHGLPADRLQGGQPLGDHSNASRPWSQTHPPPQVAHQTKPQLPPRSPRPTSSTDASAYPATGPQANFGEQAGPPGPSGGIYHWPAQSDQYSPHMQLNPGFPQHTSQNLGASNVHQSHYGLPSQSHDQIHHQAPPANPPLQQHNSIQLPPQPPPLPPGYQVELQKNQQASPQHPPYSYQPPTHRYDPPGQPTHRYDPPGQQAVQQQPGHTHSGEPHISHSYGSSYHPETPPLSSRPPPPPPPPKTPEGFYHYQYSEGQPGQYAPSQTPSSMPILQPQPMSQPNTWAPSPQQPGALPSPPPQYSHQAPHSNPSWSPAPDFTPASTSQFPQQNVDARIQGEVHPTSALHTPNTMNVQSTQPGYQESKAEAWNRFASRASTPSSVEQQTSPRHSAVQPNRQNTRRSRFTVPEQDWQGRPQASYSQYVQPQQEILERPITDAHQPDSNTSASQVGIRASVGGQYGGIQSQEDVYRPGSAQNYQQNSVPLGASRPKESQSEQYDHVVPSGKPPSQVDVSGQQQISQKAQQVPESDISLVAQPSHPTAASTHERRQDQSVSGIGASLLGSPGGISDWELYGTLPDDGTDDKLDQNTHGAKPRLSLAEDRMSSTLEDHPSSLSHEPTPSIPAPLQPHPRDMYSNIAATSSPPPNHGRSLPTPPLSGEPIENASGKTESVVSLEGFSSGKDSSQHINRVINAWSQPVPNNSFESRNEAGIQDTRTDIASSNRASSFNQGETRLFTESKKADLTSERLSHQREGRSSEPVSESFFVDGGIFPGTTNLNDNAKDGSSDRGPKDAQTPVEHGLGLDPWYKESLARYASMLRKESQATSPEERLKAFTDFLALECQQRGIPYNPTYGTDLGTNKEALWGHQDSGEKHPVQPSDNKLTSQDDSQNLLSNQIKEASLAPQVLSVQTQSETQPQTQDSDDEQYSPGGRPLLRPVYMKQEVDLKKTAHMDSHATKDTASAAQNNASETTTLPEPDSPGRNAPIAIESDYTSLDRPQTERLDSTFSVVSTELSWYDPPQNSTLPSQSDLGASLKMVLPRDRQPARRQGEHVATIQKAMNNIPDDFTVFDRLHRDWETEANRIRQMLDDERQKRQEEQEAHTDQLFAEKQIGYADIKPLEEELKRSETARKLKEDEAEYQDYIQKIFDFVYTQLQEQIKALMKQYTSCVNVLKTAVGGKGLLEQHNNLPNLAPVVDLLLELYTRIEVRHGKVLNAVLARDRRYKKTVLQPLATAGAIVEMKESEKHFDEAEKKTTFEAAVKKEERAKALVHVISESTTRVLAEDMEYIHLIATEVRKVSEEEFSSLDHNVVERACEASSDLRKDLTFARKVLQTLANVDVAIMRHAHTAALILNLAKYDVANASAKIANAGSEELTRLRDLKSRDDEQLGQALQRRLRTVEQDVKKAVEIIDGVLARLAPDTNLAPRA
ncbi:MAG: hypothetical protein M1816_003050 [Peltula sp. TS41687]|nr:MAG: hypothetical protein M1816_003050 [Peltula sp. TS41687]